MAFPVEERFIMETERKLGANLPLDYVRKMLIENGGEVQTLVDDGFKKIVSELAIELQVNHP